MLMEWAIECERPHLFSNACLKCVTQPCGKFMCDLFLDTNTLTGKVALVFHKQAVRTLPFSSRQSPTSTFISAMACICHSNTYYTFMAILFLSTFSTAISLPLSSGSGQCRSSAWHIDYWTKMQAVEEASIN